MNASWKHFTALTLIATSLSACGPAKWSEAPGGDGSGELANPKTEPTPPIVQSPKISQRFEQDQNANKVDILIINDNSASMDSEQKKMGMRFGSFVSAFNGIDYQIAMTTTDLDSAKWAQNGKIITWAGTTTKILTPRTPNASTVFSSTIQRNETIGCRDRNGGRDCPSGNEQPLKAMMMAIDERYAANRDFFRSNVDLVVVVLSDEDELSTAPSSATRPEQVIERVQAAFGSAQSFAVHGIIIRPGDTACKAEQDAQIREGWGAAYGTRVDALATLTFGSTSSICDTDYAKNLAAISEKVRKLLSTFELDRDPKTGTVEVSLTPAQNIGHRVEGRRVIFNSAPAAGTRIEISYLLAD